MNKNWVLEMRTTETDVGSKGGGEHDISPVEIKIVIDHQCYGAFFPWKNAVMHCVSVYIGPSWVIND